MVCGAWTIITFCPSSSDLLSFEVNATAQPSPALAERFAGHKYLRPKSIHDQDVLTEYSKYYMYLACIQFINSVCCSRSGDPLMCPP